MSGDTSTGVVASALRRGGGNDPTLDADSAGAVRQQLDVVIDAMAALEPAHPDRDRLAATAAELQEILELHCQFSDMVHSLPAGANTVPDQLLRQITGLQCNYVKDCFADVCADHGGGDAVGTGLTAFDRPAPTRFDCIWPANAHPEERAVVMAEAASISALAIRRYLGNLIRRQIEDDHRTATTATSNFEPVPVDAPIPHPLPLAPPAPPPPQNHGIAGFADGVEVAAAAAPSPSPAAAGPVGNAPVAPSVLLTQVVAAVARRREAGFDADAHAAKISARKALKRADAAQDSMHCSALKKVTERRRRVAAATKAEAERQRLLELEHAGDRRRAAKEIEASGGNVPVVIVGLAPTLELFQSAPTAAPLELHKVMAPRVITKVNSRGSLLEAGIDGYRSREYWTRAQRWSWEERRATCQWPKLAAFVRSVYFCAYRHQRVGDAGGRGHPRGCPQPLPVLPIELWDHVLAMVQHEVPTLDIRSAAKPTFVAARDLERSISTHRSMLRPA